MNAVIILLALSAVIGFALGSFSWFAILISSVTLAVLSSGVLQMQGFGAYPGIAIVVSCLTVNQVAYLVGALRAHYHSGALPRGQTDEEPRHKVPSRFA